MNPFRSLAPALINDNFAAQWVGLGLFLLFEIRNFLSWPKKLMVRQVPCLLRCIQGRHVENPTMVIFISAACPGWSLIHCVVYVKSAQIYPIRKQFENSLNLHLTRHLFCGARSAFSARKSIIDRNSNQACCAGASCQKNITIL